MRYISLYLVAMFIRFACVLSTQFKRKLRNIKTLPHTCACALQQPHIQYHIALLLATILAFLLGWPLFLSLFAHTPFAFIGHI